MSDGLEKQFRLGLNFHGVETQLWNFSLVMGLYFRASSGSILRQINEANKCVRDKS